MFFYHNLVSDRQSQACPFADCFRYEPSIEDFCSYFLGHPFAVITDANFHTVGLKHLSSDRNLLQIDLEFVKRSPFGHFVEHIDRIDL